MVHIAAITPRGGQGEIDAGAVFELIDDLSSALKGHTGAIVLFDAAGEYPSLSAADRTRVLKLAVKRSRVPVMAGVGAATIDLSVDLARCARDAGAEAVLLPPPFFYSLRQSELRDFYLEFAAHSGVNAYLQHLPDFTAGIEVETARGLLATGRFSGIVDATGEHAAAGLLPVFANDRLLARARCSGAAVISAAACAVPELVLALDAAVTAGNSAEADRCNGRLQEFLDWCDEFPPFAALRVATGLRGHKTGPLALPLSVENQKRMQEFQEWFRAWK